MRRYLLVFLILAAVPCCAARRRSVVPVETVKPHAHVVSGVEGDYDPLFTAMGRAHLVLLGEATHGTHEFYRERSRLTQRLIRERQFTALALEADWADAARVDRYVRGTGNDPNAVAALGGFTRFPLWMWRNQEFAELVEAIRAYNDALPAGAIEVGVYGLDLYGLGDSINDVVENLGQVDPAAATEARTRYGCFGRYLQTPELYGEDLARRRTSSCERIAREQFDAINTRYERADAADKRTLDALFYALQNARVVRNAEEYYREQPLGRVSTWNLRDRHMVDTMRAVHDYLVRRNGHDNIVVWAHNSHVGDARATDSARYGEWNIGQLVREGWPRESSFTVGFATYEGTVMAAHDWGEPGEVRTLRPALPDSHAGVLHTFGLPAFYLILGEVQAEFVREPRRQRAVGVLYRPETEIASHYFTATLREQFDAVIYFDQTTAVTPIKP